MVNISELVSSGAEKLIGTTDNPRAEARILLAHATGMSVSDILIHPEKQVDQNVQYLEKKHKK